MRSRIYECKVLHARFLPRAHRFDYRIFMLALDLDELDQLQRRLRLFSVNRGNIFSFRERDFLPLADPLHHPTDAKNREERPNDFNASSLKARVLARLAAEGIDPGPEARVELVTLPRMLGYLFNPVSFYFCYDREGTCVASIAEVTNTFREMKPYVLGPSTIHPTPRPDPHVRNTNIESKSPAGGRVGAGRKAGVFRLRTPKYFYVSPFSDVDVAFDFKLRPPGDHLAIQIDDYVGSDRTLTSTLAGPSRPLTDGTLAWFLLKYPLLTLRVIALIHWHALRLYWKKIPWFAKSGRPADQRDLYRPHASISQTTPRAHQHSQPSAHLSS